MSEKKSDGLGEEKWGQTGGQRRLAGRQTNGRDSFKMVESNRLKKMKIKRETMKVKDSKAQQVPITNEP